MQRAGMPEAAIAAAEPYIWESDANGVMKKVRPYTVDYRRQVEGDIAKASVDFIQRKAKAKQPFFLYVGFTHTHYPTRHGARVRRQVAHRRRTATRSWSSTTAPARCSTRSRPPASRTTRSCSGSPTTRRRRPRARPTRARGSNGPFRGELGDATRRLDPHRRHDQVAGQDRAARRATRWCRFTTGSRRSPASSARRCPTDRPIDGVDQGAFLIGKQAKSNRESLITFIGEEIAAVRWRQLPPLPEGIRDDHRQPAR